MRRKTIIIGLAAALVLAVGVTILRLLPETENEPSPSPIVTAPASVTADLFMALKINVQSIDFTPQSGMAYTLWHDLESGGVELTGGAGIIFPGIPGLTDIVFSHAIWLVNRNLVTEQATDSQLALFGFDMPFMHIGVRHIDGTLTEIEVGAEQVTGEGRYARRSGSREIFILSAEQSTALTLSLDDMRDLSFFPHMSYSDELAAVNSINNVIIETDGGVIEVRRRTEEDYGQSQLAISDFEIMQPIVVDSADYIVETQLLRKIVGIIPSKIEAAHPADLSIYGLDAPSKLTVETGDWNGTLLIGKQSTDGRYVMIEGYDAVLLDMQSDYSFLDLTVSDLRTGISWIFSIIDTISVAYDLEGAVRTLRIEHGGDDSLQGRLDDMEISETNTRRLFLGALMIYPAGETDYIIPANASPAYVITVHFKDGKTSALELYPQSDSQFVIAIDGENTGFYTTRMLIQQNLLRRFEIIDSGGDIPAG